MAFPSLESATASASFDDDEICFEMNFFRSLGHFDSTNEDAAASASVVFSNAENALSLMSFCADDRDVNVCEMSEISSLDTASLLLTLNNA